MWNKLLLILLLLGLATTSYIPSKIFQQYHHKIKITVIEVDLKTSFSPDMNKYLLRLLASHARAH